MILKSLIKDKIKQLNYERDLILDKRDLFSIPRTSSEPPVTTFGYMMADLALKVCEMKIAILEAIIGEMPKKEE